MERKINPNLLKLAELTHNPNLKPVNLEEQAEEVFNAPNLDGFVYVPSINLYFAKERSLLGRSWNDTNKELLSNKENVRMPTPRETWELIFYLKDNLSQQGFREVYDDILKITPQNTWHGELQNAIFSKDNGVMYIQRAIGIAAKGKLVLSKKERLEACLMQDCLADSSSLGNITSQGLCENKAKSHSYEQGKNVYFWYPREGYVAGFDVDSGIACLYCGRHPDSSYPSLGVRVVRETHTEIGE